MKISAILILVGFTLGRSPRTSKFKELRAIRSLLEKLFEQYESQMSKLSEGLAASEVKFKRVERSVKERMKHLEAILSTVTRSRNEGRISPRGSGQSTAEGDRLSKLEGLSKVYARRTCHEMKQLGISVTGRYFIDPDGFESNSDAPVQVHCDMSTGTTRIDHDLVGEQRISSCREPGCSIHRVRYDLASTKQVAFLIALSDYCEQHISYDCKGSRLNRWSNASKRVEPLAWWTDSHGKAHYYWHSDVAVGCLCKRENATLCSRSGCNCDSSANETWMTDEGHLTNHDHLPVTKLNFRGNGGVHNRSASFELGPLYCSGQAVPSSDSRVTGFESSSPTSCQDLLLRGTTQIGYFMVRSRQEKFPKIVFCDMSKRPDQVGFQRMFGSPGNLRHFVAFDASLSESVHADYRYLNFSRANVNLIGDDGNEHIDGAGFNIRDGMFKVPVSGVYLLSVHALPMEDRPCRLQIHRNGIAVAELSNGKKGGTVG